MRHLLLRCLRFSSSVSTRLFLVPRAAVAFSTRGSAEEESEPPREEPLAIWNRVQLACRHKRLIKAAAREKGPFLEYNPKLAAIIEEAKRCGLSELAIDYNVKCTLEPRNRIGMHEIQFPGKGLFVVQYETVDIAIVDHKIMRVCDPYDATLASSEGRRQEYYDPRGTIVVVRKPSGQVLDASDRQRLTSLGADSVQEDSLVVSELRLLVHCSPSKFLRTKKRLEAEGYAIEEAHMGLLPKHVPRLPKPALNQAARFLLDLSAIPELDRIFVNVMDV